MSKRKVVVVPRDRVVQLQYEISFGKENYLEILIRRNTEFKIQILKTF